MGLRNNCNGLAVKKASQVMRIGLIAGNGQFPILFTKAAKAKGIEVYAVAHLKEADPSLEDHVDGIEWIHLGQLKRPIAYFKEHHITEAVMIGGIRKTRIFTDLRLDTKAVAIISNLRSTHDDGILRAVAKVFENEGITIKPSTFLLPELLAPKGCWTRRKPKRTEWANIDLGWKLAKEIGRLDIGQCVVAGNGSILAVEAIEGTDATIRRGAALGKGSVVVVKVCKPNQDYRFDIPAVGLKTIHTMHEAGARVLAIEAGKAVVFDRQEMIDLANRFGITILALKGIESLSLKRNYL